MASAWTLLRMNWTETEAFLHKQHGYILVQDECWAIPLSAEKFTCTEQTTIHISTDHREHDSGYKGQH